MIAETDNNDLQWLQRMILGLKQMIAKLRNYNLLHVYSLVVAITLGLCTNSLSCDHVALLLCDGLARSSTCK